MQGIVSKSILRELLLKAARRRLSNVSKSVVGLRHLTRTFSAICIILSVNSKLLTFCNIGSVIVVDTSLLYASSRRNIAG